MLKDLSISRCMCWNSFIVTRAVFCNEQAVCFEPKTLPFCYSFSVLKTSSNTVTFSVCWAGQLLSDYYHCCSINFNFVTKRTNSVGII